MIHPVRLIRTKANSRYPVMFSGAGAFPVALPARYLATERLGKKESPNTVRHRLQAIAWFYSWALALHTPWDPEIRLLEPNPLSKEQISSLASFLRVADHDPNLVSLESRGRSGSMCRRLLKPETIAHYLRYARDFVKWAFETQSVPRLSADRVAAMTTDFNREIDDLGNVGKNEPPTLTPEEQARIMAICMSHRPDNPFNSQVRIRNHAIVRLLLTTGIRRGEALKLRLEDLKPDGAIYTISVVKQDESTPSERFDTRGTKPRQKTRPRKIPLTPDTKNALLDYIRRGRSRHATSPFIFLSSRGDQPLAVTAVNNIFTQIMRRFPDEFPNLHPHLLRHVFNYNFKLHNQTAKMKGEQLQQVQNYINGWSDRSKQAAHYGSAANTIIADKHIRAMYAKMEEQARARFV